MMTMFNDMRLSTKPRTPTHQHCVIYSKESVGQAKSTPLFFKPRKWVGTARYGLWDTILPSTPPLTWFEKKGSAFGVTKRLFR